MAKGLNQQRTEKNIYTVFIFQFLSLVQPYTKGAAVTTPEHTPEPEFSTLEQTAVPTAEPEIYTTDSCRTEIYTGPEELWP